MSASAVEVVSRNPENMKGDAGKWFQTYTGVKFYFYRPTVDMINIEDIAQSLSMQCRFGGHLRRHYSVAEHSYRVAELVAPEYRLKALLHDASEAYLADVVRPLKYSSAFSGYFDIENNITQVIFDKFGLDYEMHPSIKEADNIMLLTEHRDLRKKGVELWGDFDKWGVKPLDVKIKPWGRPKAKEMFLRAIKLYS